MLMKLTLVLFTAAMRPFKIIFRTDGDEITTIVSGSAGSSNTDEQVGIPGGIIGFSLTYNQVAC
jgi:hypothetical protein